MTVCRPSRTAGAFENILEFMFLANGMPCMSIAGVEIRRMSFCVLRIFPQKMIRRSGDLLSGHAMGMQKS